VKEALLRHRQLLLYCIIGASGVTLDFSTYSIFLKTGILHYQAANAVGYTSGTLLTFFLNARYNFKVRDRVALRLFSFCMVAFFGWAASAATLYLLVSRFNLDKYLAKLITLVMVVILQYNLNRLISFRKSAAKRME